MRKQKGFSLIELLIVVAIILIIAAIAIPSLLRSRMAANDSSAASTVRTINTAEVSYLTAYPTQGYAQSLANLGTACTAVDATSAHACLVDLLIGCAAGTKCPKSGYNYFLTGTAPAANTPAQDYVVSAGAITVGSSGNAAFCSMPDGVIRRFIVAAGGQAPQLAAAVPLATCSDNTAYGPTGN
jgi:type IV pilus assembly protein PilA